MSLSFVELKRRQTGLLMHAAVTGPPFQPARYPRGLQSALHLSAMQRVQTLKLPWVEVCIRPGPADAVSARG